MQSKSLIRKVFIIVVLLILGMAIQNAAVGQVALPRALALAQTIPAHEAEADSYFGQVMAVDGDTAVIAAPRLDSVEGDQTGAVYVYVNNGDEWEFQQKLSPSDPGADDNFGASIAIDGDTVVVGAPIKNANMGAVYVYTRTGTTWTQQTILNNGADASENDLFGSALALEGTTLAVGAPREGSGIFPQGAVYVYEGSGASWAFDQKLTITDGIAGDFFGASLALDGTRLLIGSPFQSTSFDDTFVGAAYVFTLSAGDWGQTGKLTAQDGVREDYFGWSVDLEANTALVGAPQSIGIDGFPNELPGGGKAYAFTYNGSTWAQQASALTASDAGTDERFGWQVILNGNTAHISDDGADERVDMEDRADVGAVYSFSSNGTAWMQAAKLSPDAQFIDKEFGGSIALVGGSLLVSAPGTANDAGEVYVYADDTPAETPTSTGTLDAPTATTAVTVTSAATATTALTLTITPITTTDIATPTPTETAPGMIELLTNGGFETQSEGQTQPDGWTAKSVNTSGKRKCNKPGKDIAFEGECLYQFKSSVGEKSGLQQNPSITDLAAGDILTLSGFVRASGTVNAKVKVRVTYVDTTLDKGKITAKITAPAADYEALTGILPLSLVDEPAAVKVQLQNKGTSGKVRFDALSLVKESGAALLPLP